jgi:hypothetical protein
VIIIRLAILVLTEAVVIIIILPFRLFLVVGHLGLGRKDKHAFEQRRVSPAPRTLGRRRQEEQSSGKPNREG